MFHMQKFKTAEKGAHLNFRCESFQKLSRQFSEVFHSFSSLFFKQTLDKFLKILNRNAAGEKTSGNKVREC